MEGIPDKEDVYKLGAAVGTELAQAAEAAAVETLKEIAELFWNALSALRDIDVEAVSEDLLNELEKMKELGLPIAADCMEAIQGQLCSILSHLEDEDVQKLQVAIGRIAVAGFADFMNLWNELENVVAAAIKDGRELAQESLPVITAALDTLGEVGEDATEAIGSAVAVTVDATKKATVTAAEIYNSDAVQDIIGAGFGEIDDAIGQSREGIQTALNALAGFTAGGCAAFCPLIRFEIFRDFWQTISLFFTNFFADVSEAPWLESAKGIFGGIGNFMAIDVAAALQSEEAVKIGIIVLILVAVVMYIAYVWFAISAQYMHSTENEIREGHETKKWADVAAENSKKIKMSTHVLTGCLSVYLPLTRTAVEVVLDNKDSFVVKYFEGGSELDLLRFASYFILLTFTLPLPFILARIVTRNKPAGSLENPDIAYDVDGEEVPFDDKLYNRLVTQDPNQIKCPYRSLYKGFERKWAHYKIYQLVYKATLVLVVVSLATADTAQPLVTLGVYSIMAGMSFYATPFIDFLDDMMDASGRITALITCSGGVLLALTPDSPSAHQIIGLLLSVANAVNMIVMGSVFAYGMEKCRLFMKNFRGTFTFSDTVLDIPAAPAWKIVPEWDIERECKHRIWHTFWENVLFYKCGENTALRLMELKDATANSGLANIKAHWDGEADAQLSGMRMKARTELEGVDVYWNDATGTRDGTLDSKTCFGKMYINPYPFHCIVIYDDAKDESFIRHQTFEKFFELNTSNDIVRKRKVRQTLRAISEWAGSISFPFSRMETETVADGTKTVTTTDGEGNTSTHQETNYSTVSFLCSYKEGVISVDANSKKAMSAGFNVSMSYNDGTGEARLPNTGKMHHFRNRHATMGHDHLDLKDDMEESGKLTTIFATAKHGWSKTMPVLLNEHNAYRAALIQEFEDSNKILGNGFWYYVYNNSHLPRDALERYIGNSESNAYLSALPTDHVAALNFVYKRMDFVKLHPVMGLWYVFWDDFYAQNKNMTVVSPLDDDFNPLKGTSICYRVMKKEELQKWLTERKLMGSKPSWKTSLTCASCLFHEDILEPLYRRIGKMTDPHNVEIKV